MKESFLDRLGLAKTQKKKLTIYLSKELAKRLKVYAAENERPISQVIEDALTSKLKSVK